MALPDKYHMKLSTSLMLIFFTVLALSMSWSTAQETVYYKNQRRSLIQWEGMDAEAWLSFDNFERNQNLKDKQPKWETILQEKNKQEIVGRVIDCIGLCRTYVGMGFHHPEHRSTIREGDEFTTIGNTYAWVYLLDGTIVRVSPESSITFKELNVGKKEFFVHARVNYGNIFWMAREDLPIKEHNDRDTDTYFLPLSTYEANKTVKEKEVDEDDLFALLDEPTDNLNHVKKLNAMINENNEVAAKKKSYVFIVTPNGTVTGYDPFLELIVLLGNKSYVKKRKRTFQLYPEEAENPPLRFHFRGFENQIIKELPDGTWMEIGKNGRVIGPYTKYGKFAFGELLSKRITSIMIAREVYFQRYSKEIFETNDPLEMAEKYGYKLWEELKLEDESEKKSDMKRRFEFLVEYTRRLETSNLLSANKLKRKLKERGDILPEFNYSDRFYRTALATYLNNVEMKATSNSDREVLNSTTKNLWKLINAKR